MALLLGGSSPARRKRSCVLRGPPEFLVALAGFWRGLIGHFTRKRNRSGEEIALDDSIDDAEFQGFLGFNRVPAHTHLDRLRDAGEPRQALRAARARDESEFHFRLAQPVHQQQQRDSAPPSPVPIRRQEPFRGSLQSPACCCLRSSGTKEEVQRHAACLCRTSSCRIP